MEAKIDQPLVSVIMPVYNAEAYLERCLNSVLDQSYDQLEIILVDDGSTDSSSSICDSYATTDSRICVIHKDNGGLSSARNRGLESIHGDYIMYVDSDDFIGPDHVINLLAAALETEADIAVTSFTPIPDSANIPSMPAWRPSEYQLLSPVDAICASLRIPNPPFAEYAWGKLFSASLAPYLVFPQDKHFEDQFIMYRVLYSANKVIYENANDYFYTVERACSITHQFDERHLDTLEARFGIIEFARKEGIPKLEEIALQRYYSGLIGEFAAFSLNGQDNLSAQVYERIRRERDDALSSPAVALTTKAAFILSYFPHAIFRAIACYSEKKYSEEDQRIAQQNAEKFKVQV